MTSAAAVSFFNSLRESSATTKELAIASSDIPKATELRGPQNLSPVPSVVAASAASTQDEIGNAIKREYTKAAKAFNKSYSDKAVQGRGIGVAAPVSLGTGFVLNCCDPTKAEFRDIQEFKDVRPSQFRTYMEKTKDFSAKVTAWRILTGGDAVMGFRTIRDVLMPSQQ